MKDYIVVLVTCASEKEAIGVKEALLRQKLCACVNMIPGIKSFFWWQGSIGTACETLLVIKTKKSLFKEVAHAVKKAHSYTTPEIIALPIVAGNKEYLAWIDTSVAAPRPHRKKGSSCSS